MTGPDQFPEETETPKQKNGLRIKRLRTSSHLLKTIFTTRDLSAVKVEGIPFDATVLEPQGYMDFDILVEHPSFEICESLADVPMIEAGVKFINPPWPEDIGEPFVGGIPMGVIQELTYYYEKHSGKGLADLLMEWQAKNPNSMSDDVAKKTDKLG